MRTKNRAVFSPSQTTSAICLLLALFLGAACSTSENAASEAGVDMKLDGVSVTDGAGTTDTTSDAAPLWDGEQRWDAAPAANTGKLSWAKGLSNEEGITATAVVTLAGGAVAVVGKITGKAIFARGTPEETAVDVGEFTPGYYLAKYKHDGRLDWVQVGKTQTESEPAVAAAADGSLLVTAMCNDGASFGSLTLSSCAMFIARYLGDGTLSWVKPITGLRTQALYPDIAADVGGGLYLSGWAAESSLTFEPDGAGHAEVSAGDSFLARYEQDGALSWVRTLGRSSGKRQLAVIAQSDGSATVAGTFTDTMVLGAGEATETTLVATQRADLFLARYSRPGNLIYAQKADLQDVALGSFPVEGRLVSLAMSATADGGMILAGSYAGLLVFDPGGRGELRLDSAGYTEPFIARLTVDGAPLWAKTYVSSPGVIETVGDISTQADGSARVAGYLEGSSLGDQAFLRSYDSSGSLLWERQTSGGATRGHGVAVADDGSTTMVGTWYGTVVFGAGEARETELSSSIEQPSLFVARFE